MTANSSRPLYLLLFATLTAAAGNGITMVAFPWLVLQRNGSAIEAAIVAGAAALPLVISTLLAGTAVDFLGRRRVSIVSDVLSGATAAGVPLLALTLGPASITVAALALLAALGAVFDPAGLTARQSMLPEVAARAGWTLDRINGVHQAVFQAAYIAGPGLAGVLIAVLGGVNAMWVTAAFFGLSIVAISALRIEGGEPPSAEERPHGVWAGTVEGFRFVWSAKVLFTLAVIDLVLTGLYVPMESVLFPKYFTDRQQPAQLGWVLMALSIGALLGALAYPILVQHLSRRKILLTSTFVLAVCVLVISTLPPLGVILLLCALVGLVFGPIPPIYNYVMQTKSPPEMRGRVVGAMTTFSFAAGPLGLMIGGPVADAFGLQVTFLVLAIPMFAIGLVSLWLRPLHELDSDPEHSVAAEPQ
jgi:MFS family permease